MSANKVIETVVETVELTEVTAYRAAKIVNERLTELNLKNIPTQMIYNYTTARVNAGKKPFIEESDAGMVVIDSLNAWLEKYVAKKQA